MLLNENGLKNREQWEAKGYRLPEYDRGKMISATKENPCWIHFGAGNIFRAFQANLAQTLLDEGIMDRGITVVEGFDYEIIEKKYLPNDNYSILVTLKSDGTVEKTVIGSIAESLRLDSENEAEFSRLKEIFENPSLQIATFTITEKGYNLSDVKGNVFPAVKADFENGPEKPVSYIGKVASLLYSRFKAGAAPIAMVSTDNCSHNGDKLYAAIAGYANAWCANGLAEKEFSAYIDDRTKVTFPWSMIDKITPRPDTDVEELLMKDGVEDTAPVVTAKNTYVSSFVNAEETEYLVVEDAFPNGRPALEKAGVIFTDRETVDKVERMKVCTCLNPLHTALAVYGCLLGYNKISDEMQDTELVKLVERIGYKEGLPVVVDPKVLNPREFIDTVLRVRVTNPFMPDTPQRIATDTSQKLVVRFGETVKNYQKTGLSLETLQGIPLVFAGWCRYLMGINDAGESFTLSPDPMLDEVCQYVKDIKLGDGAEAIEAIKPLLTNEKIFGQNLYEAKVNENTTLADVVNDFFVKLISKPGAIRETLKNVLEK